MESELKDVLSSSEVVPVLLLTPFYDTNLTYIGGGT